MSKQQDISRLKNFPVSFFAVVMGLCGLTIALQKAAELSLLPMAYGLGMAILDVGIMTLLSTIYLLKAVRYPGAVQREYQNPVKVNFFPAFAISLLLLSIVILPYNAETSRWLWWTGAALQLGMMLAIVNGWMWRKTVQLTHMSPAWFIPAVGNLIVPIAGVAHAPIELSWFFFAIGSLFWLILMSVFFNRIFFHDMMPEKLIPTMFILMAPPAIMTIVLYRLFGHGTLVGTLAYDVALFMFLLLIVRLIQFLKLRFFLSWWAYTFPLAALAIASSVMYHTEQIMVYEYLLVGFLLLTVFVVTVITLKTLRAIYHKHICLED